MIEGREGGKANGRTDGQTILRMENFLSRDGLVSFVSRWHRVKDKFKTRELKQKRELEKQSVRA